MRLISRLFLILVLLAPALAIGQATGQTVPPTGPPPAPASDPATAETPEQVITTAEIETALTALAARTDLDDATRQSAVDLYTQATEALGREEAAAARGADLRQRAAAAEERLATIRAQLDQPEAAAADPPPADATVGDLQRLRDDAQAALDAARTEVDTLSAEATRRDRRRAEIPNEMSAARTALNDIAEALQAAPGEGEATDVARARRVALHARQQANRAEIAALEIELTSYDARRELLPARRDGALRSVAELEKLVAARQTLVGDRRKREAEAAARDARRLLRDAAANHPALLDYAKEGEQLAAARTGPESLSAVSAAAIERHAEVQSLLSDLREQFLSVRKRIVVSGLDASTGLLLRQQRGTLLEPADLRRELKATVANRQGAAYELIERREQQVGASNIDEIVEGLVAQVPAADVPADVTVLRSVAQDLAKARRDLVQELVTDAANALDDLSALEVELDRLLEATLGYRAYVDERILWVRGVAGDRAPSAGEARAAMGWLFDRAAWGVGLTAVADELSENWPLHAITLAFITIAFALIPLCHRRLRSLAALVRSYRSDRLSYTFKALLYTLVLAAPLPLLVAWLARLLALPDPQPPAVLGGAVGLREAAWFLVPVTFIVALLRPDGLGDAHFRWPVGVTRVLRRYAVLLAPPLIVLMATTRTLGIYEEATDNTTLGRLTFSLSLSILFVFVVVVARPGGATMVEYFRRNPGGWLDRFRQVWVPTVMLLPIVLIAAAWTGYYYSARQIALRIDETVQLSIALILVNTLLLRWLFVARRRVAMEDARRRREQAEAEAKAAGDEEESPTEGAAIDVARLDLPAISAQTKHLIRAAMAMSIVVGLYLIWADVLPALRALDRLQLWPEVTVIDLADKPLFPELDAAAPTATAATGDAPPVSVGPDPAPTAPGLPAMPTPAPPAGAIERPHLSITVADLGLLVIALVITWVAIRNLPGLVGIVLLQRLPLDAGSRYAIDTVLRYVIAVGGIAVALGAVGITWANVQWLAAALTFGLAFGLQEIFANFVSGLIILGERPFRVGDTVTVGTTSGTVSRIRMRATTIVDWDRKELVIPNKTFVTGEVTNWTLSDAILRVTIPVGVSYDSDVKRVAELLLELADANTKVLKDPPPRALFLGFGDSTLDFQVRVFIGNIDHMLAVKHDLHNAIIAAFRAADIEIAFPQRDLHVRSTGDLAGIVRRDEPVAGELEPPAP